MAAEKDSSGWWASPVDYLTFAQMQDNAKLCWSFLGSQGWTLNAVAGALGNFQAESTLNPAIWQGRTVPADPYTTSKGYGLAQWTPANKYINWCDSKGISYPLGSSNMTYLVAEPEHKGNWSTNNYKNYTWSEYIVATDPPEICARCWLWGYERPASPNLTDRQKKARYWYDYLEGVSPEPPTPPSPWPGDWLLYVVANRKRGRYAGKPRLKFF